MFGATLSPSKSAYLDHHIYGRFSMEAADSGMPAGYFVTGATAFVIAGFLSVAFYNFFELNFIIFSTFKFRHGLYFWSFVAATWGFAANGIGFLLKYFTRNITPYIFVTIILLGWYFMITGQSLVLYSRLHLVVRDKNWLRAVLAMIIVNAIICYIPTTVLIFGSNSKHPDRFLEPYTIFEKIQVTIIFLQELIISGLYVFETTRMMQVTSMVAGSANRRMMKHLIIVNVIVILLDIGILVLEYLNLYNIQTSYKVFTYSLKLKLEFSILNRLVDLTAARNNSSFIGSADGSETLHLESGYSEVNDKQSSRGNRPEGTTEAVASTSC